MPEARPKPHRWSGWPGAWCLDCSLEHAEELDIAGPPDQVHHRYSPVPHTAQPCAGCVSAQSPCRGAAGAADLLAAIDRLPAVDVLPEEDLVEAGFDE